MAKNEIRLKRAYDDPEKGDGFRVLVDRLWPRGVSKEDAKIDLWPKEIAPSDELRKEFHDDSAKWTEFKKRYRKELENAEDAAQEGIDDILEKLKRQNVTLVYSSKDEEHNNAIVFKEYLEEKR